MSHPPNSTPSTASTVAEHAGRMPYLEAINDPLLAHLGDLSGGSLILDLACGAGEPTLPLARRYPASRVLGVDRDREALRIAQRRAHDEGLSNVEFEPMAMEELGLADRTVDAAVSRLGALLFGDPVATAREVARILKPHAPFSFALWSDVDANPYMAIGLRTLAAVVPADQVFDFGGYFEPLSQPATVEGWLTQAGMTAVSSEVFTWQIRFPDFESWWQYNTSGGPLGPQFAGLDEDQRRAARDRMRQLMNHSKMPSGGYGLASRCRLVWGSR